MEIKPSITPLKALFGHNLRRVRRAHDMSQEQLAELTGVSVETISFIERGIHGPRFGLIEKITQVLQVDAAKLFSSAGQSDHY